MAARRRRGRLRKLDRSKRKRSDLVVAHDLEDAVRKSEPGVSKRGRYYRGPGNTIVIWQAGRFWIESADPKRCKSLGRLPRGLATRVQTAIEEGKASG